MYVNRFLALFRRAPVSLLPDRHQVGDLAEGHLVRQGGGLDNPALAVDQHGLAAAREERHGARPFQRGRSAAVGQREEPRERAMWLVIGPRVPGPLFAAAGGQVLAVRRERQLADVLPA